MATNPALPTATSWAHGAPKDLADAFIAAVGRRRNSFSRSQYPQVVSAIAAAHMHQVLQHLSGEPAAQRLHNILETAQTIVERTKKLPSEDEDDDDSDYEDEEESEWEEANSDDLAAAAAAAAVPTPPAAAAAETAAAAPQAPSQTLGKSLPVLQQLVRKITNATPTSAPPPSATPRGAPSSSAAPPSVTSSTQTAGLSTPPAADNGLPVATPLLHSIYSCLDSCSAAKAAAACKQLSSIKAKPPRHTSSSLPSLRCRP
jgi:hypothetical protein